MPQANQPPRSTYIPKPSVEVRPVVPQRPASRPGITGFLSREQVLTATAECFADAGYDGTTIRAIAKRLGCAVGSIYRYFNDKRELLQAAAELILEPIAAELDQPNVTFAQSVRTYLHQATHHSEAYRLLFWLAAVAHPQSPTPPEPVQQIIDRWGQMLDDPEQASRRWAQMHGLIMLGREADQIAGIVTGESAGGQTEAGEGGGDDSDSAGSGDVTLL